MDKLLSLPDLPEGCGVGDKIKFNEELKFDLCVVVNDNNRYYLKYLGSPIALKVITMAGSSQYSILGQYDIYEIVELTFSEYDEPIMISTENGNIKIHKISNIDNQEYYRDMNNKQQAIEESYIHPSVIAFKPIISEIEQNLKDTAQYYQNKRNEINRLINSVNTPELINARENIINAKEQVEIQTKHLGDLQTIYNDRFVHFPTFFTEDNDIQSIKQRCKKNNKLMEYAIEKASFCKMDCEYYENQIKSLNKIIEELIHKDNPRYLPIIKEHNNKIEEYNKELCRINNKLVLYNNNVIKTTDEYNISKLDLEQAEQHYETHKNEMRKNFDKLCDTMLNNINEAKLLLSELIEKHAHMIEIEKTLRNNDPTVNELKQALIDHENERKQMNEVLRHHCAEKERIRNEIYNEILCRIKTQK